MKAYDYQDKVFTFEGSVSVQVEERWCKPWRIDFQHIKYYPHVDNPAEKASGVRIVFNTDSENIVLVLHEVFENMKMDLFSDGKLLERYTCNNSNEVLFSKLSKGKKKIDIWLDPRFPFSLENVLIDDFAKIEPLCISQKRWVHYGSSISHSRSAESPSAIWTGIVSRKLDLHLTNLGFAGNCVLEPMVARMIRDMEADIITLKLGINCVSGALSNRTFETSAIGLISIIRDKHPQIPLFVISPIFSPDREDTRFFQYSLTLKEMREILKTVVEKFKQYGDRKISYINGLDILGEAELEYLPDRLHPDALGQYVIAENFIKAIANDIID